MPPIRSVGATEGMVDLVRVTTRNYKINEYNALLITKSVVKVKTNMKFSKIMERTKKNEMDDSLAKTYIHGIANYGFTSG